MRTMRTVVAPVISSTMPRAAIGTSTGAMSSMAGSVSPAAASTVTAPILLMKPGLNSST
nr:hypothetical protein [Ornithinicoccus halotolerans]